jgi:transposase
MELYVGMDLHSNNTYVGILDKITQEKVYHKRLPNELPKIVYELEPFRKDIRAITVESTFNWYWLVDGLMDSGYEVCLANPAANQQYKGLKHSNDKSDAFWLAHMLSLGVLKKGYIYPKEERPLRDLFRKRTFFVHQRTSNILSLQGLINRSLGRRINSNSIKTLTQEKVDELFKDDHSRLIATSGVNTIKSLDREIKSIEKAVLEKAKLRKEFENLLSVPGIGKVLALTIMYEVGDISRFEKVGNFSSYSRCISGKWTSNDKVKGKGNSKNGNKHLAWAFVEAANIARRYNKKLNAFYQRKESSKNSLVATKALAHKLSRACYYIMKDQVPYKEEMLVS